MSNLFDELEKAINEGDLEEVQRLQAKILKGGRDTSLDENMLASINGKPLYKNILKILNGEEEYSVAWYIKVISSLLTHNVIESEVTGKDMYDYPIKELYVVLGSLVNNKEGAINDAKVFIKDRYGEFFEI